MSVIIQWLGHASFRLRDGQTVYLDPWKLKAGGVADVIIVSHSHYDHLSVEDVKKLQGPNTVIVTTADCAAQLRGQVRTVRPGEKVEVGAVTVEAVPAYNPAKQFHPRANGWIGAVVTLGGKRIYYAGDTDRIPEMGQLTDIDVALLPVGGTYTMDAREAALAANQIKPRVAIPYHWGDIVGSRRDAETFAKACAGEVRVLEPGDSTEVAE